MHVSTSLLSLLPLSLLHIPFTIASPEAGCNIFHLQNTTSQSSLMNTRFNQISEGIICTSKTTDKNADTCSLPISGVFNTTSWGNIEADTIRHTDQEALRKTIGTAVNEPTNNTYYVGIPAQTMNVSVGFAGYASWRVQEKCYEGLVDDCAEGFAETNSTAKWCFPQLDKQQSYEGYPVILGSAELINTTKKVAKESDEDPAENHGQVLRVDRGLVVGVFGLAALLLS